MQSITGIYKGHGAGVFHWGGIRYEYIRIKQDDGRVINVPKVTAYTNVQSALDHLNEVDQDCRITLHADGYLVYAVEAADGTIYSDYNTIRTAWLSSLAHAFGPWVVAFFLFASGDDTLGIGGIILLLLGIITLIKYWRGTIIFKPSKKAKRLLSRA